MPRRARSSQTPSAQRKKKTSATTRHLESLETAGLLHLTAAQPEVAYLFRHVLIQEAAYSSLLKTDRRALHLAVGEVLESLYVDELGASELAPVLGEHFALAQDDARALKYYKLAGEAAAKIYANLEAAQHYTHALQLLQRAPDDHALAVFQSIYLGLGRSYEMTGRHLEAQRCYEDLERLALTRADRPTQLAALVAQATLHAAPTAVRDIARGTALCEQALRLAQELGDRAAEAKIYWCLMLLARVNRQVEAVFRYGELAIALSRELDLTEQLAFALNDIALAYGFVGRFERGLTYLEEARVLWRMLGNRAMLADNLASAGFGLLLNGRLTEGQVLIEEAYALNREINNAWGQGYSLWALGNCQFYLGDLRAAYATWEAAQRLSEAAGFIAGPPSIYLMTALGEIELGAPASALPHIQQVLSYAERYPVARTSGQALLSLAHLRLGQMPEAQTALEAARASQQVSDILTGVMLSHAEIEMALALNDLARALEHVEHWLTVVQRTSPINYPSLLTQRARILLRLDQPDAARETLQTACQMAEHMLVRFWAWQPLSLLADLTRQQGHPAEADALHQQAREVIDFIREHCPPHLAEAFHNKSSDQLAVNSAQ